MLRFLTAGESHGLGLTAILEGIPAGLKIEKEKINEALSLRQVGYGRSERQTKVEIDTVEILSGLKGGVTLGSPIALFIKNKDNSIETAAGVFCPRPGHADLAGALKYKHKDLRCVLERASARETAARVAVGAVCEILLEEFGIFLLSHTVDISGIEAHTSAFSFEQIKSAVKKSVLRCADEAAGKLMIEEIDKMKEAGDTLGGVFEVIAKNIPAGLGSYVHYDRRLDAKLASALMSIPSVKGVEIGMGFGVAAKAGSDIHDEIFYDKKKKFYRKTNNAGGLEGGVTNGEDVVLRAAVKPIPTLMKPLSSVDINTKEKKDASVQRSDVCVVPACGVIGEAMTAFEISGALLEKFGSDNMEDIKKAFDDYIR
ncbi:MAG: chorismate synthase [Candidatus Omnitrophota bacterium]